MTPREFMQFKPARACLKLELAGVSDLSGMNSAFLRKEFIKSKPEGLGLRSKLRIW
jgi:hypothetical protein